MGKFQTAESRAAAPGGSAAGGPGSAAGGLGSAGLGAGGAAGAAGAAGGAAGGAVAGASMSTGLQATWEQADLVDALEALRVGGDDLQAMNCCTQDESEAKAL